MCHFRCRLPDFMGQKIAWETPATDNCAVQTASIIPAVSHLSIMHRITPSLIRRSRISRKRWCAILRNISRCSHPSPNAGVHACSAIHCCFVNVFMSLCVLSIVSHQWLCRHDAPLSSDGSRWTRFPAVISTIRALRLPALHAFGLLIHLPVPPFSLPVTCTALNAPSEVQTPR